MCARCRKIFKWYVMYANEPTSTPIDKLFHVWVWVDVYMCVYAQGLKSPPIIEKFKMWLSMSIDFNYLD